MTPYEMEHFIKGREEAKREEWERTRMIVYAIVQSQSRTRLNPRDVWPFEWDKERPAAAVPTKEEREQLEQELETFEKILYGEK